jgi:hypothetical protein
MTAVLGSISQSLSSLVAAAGSAARAAATSATSPGGGDPSLTSRRDAEPARTLSADRFDRATTRAPGEPTFVPAPAGPYNLPSPPPPPMAPSTADPRARQTFELVKDGKLSAAEARTATDLARTDAKLPAGTTDAKLLEPALTNLYVRSGVPLDEARSVARRTVAGGSADIPVDLKRAQPKPALAPFRAQAEGDVASNPARDKVWTGADIAQDRAGFLRNASQIDGNAATTTDHTACVGTSFVAGVVLSDPAKAPELAQKLLSPQGKAAFPNTQDPAIKPSLERMASGNYSPRDVSVVGNALVDSQQYVGDDGKQTTGMTLGRESAMLGKLQGIGFTPPAMRRDTYATAERNGPHSNVYANGTGYDPWPYSGNNGQAVITDGPAAAASHGRSIGPRIGLPEQQRLAVETVEHDGKGGMTITRRAHDDKVLSPPISASYSYDASKQAWVRDPSAQVPAQYTTALPALIPTDASLRKGQYFETT